MRALRYEKDKVLKFTLVVATTVLVPCIFVLVAITEPRGAVDRRHDGRIAFVADDGSAHESYSSNNEINATRPGSTYLRSLEAGEGRPDGGIAFVADYDGDS